jgi:hypothetical protein
MNKQTYDLGDRLLEYSVRIIKIVEQLPNLTSFCVIITIQHEVVCQSKISKGVS